MWSDSPNRLGDRLQRIVRGEAISVDSYGPFEDTVDGFAEAQLFPSWLILVFKLTADFGDRFAEVVG
jgi:hypothetical protein